MANETILPISLDEYFQASAIGSIDKAIGNNLYGINHRKINTPVPSNKDDYGLTFFVRPQLNLQTDNIRNTRRFSPLLTQMELSMHRYIRCMLDPRLMYGYKFNNHSIPPISCPVVDNMNAFIPVLTNNLNNISGWPDLVVPTFTSEPGLYNESYSMIDGLLTNYSTFDITATFRNTRGDPILFLFYVWLYYGSMVFEGKLVPYIDFITENEIDYNTRIYRLVLDQQKNVVTKIAATGAAFPLSVPTASFFDFTNERPFNDQNKDISIRFRCMGFESFEDILIKEFNKTVVIFNPAMHDNVRDAAMVKVTKNIVQLFNNRGYPRINPNNYELEWWVDRELYVSRTNLFIENNLANPTTQDNIFTGD